MTKYYVIINYEIIVWLILSYQLLYNFNYYLLSSFSNLGSDCHSSRNPKSPNGADCKGQRQQQGGETNAPPAPHAALTGSQQSSSQAPFLQWFYPPSGSPFSSLLGPSPQLLPQRVACIKVATDSCFFLPQSFLFSAFDSAYAGEPGSCLSACE